MATDGGVHGVCVSVYVCEREGVRGGRPVEMLLQNSTALQIAPIHGVRAHSESLCAQVRTHRERLQAFSVARRCAQGELIGRERPPIGRLKYLLHGSQKVGPLGYRGVLGKRARSKLMAHCAP